jgi:hypothetical protein
MQILVKRTKLFAGSEKIIENAGKDAAGNDLSVDKEVRHFAPALATPQQAPDWIKNTLTYKVGIVDGSIIDLTPAVTKLPAEVTKEGAKPPAAPQQGGQSKPKGDNGLQGSEGDKTGDGEGGKGKDAK